MVAGALALALLAAPVPAESAGAHVALTPIRGAEFDAPFETKVRESLVSGLERGRGVTVSTAEQLRNVDPDEECGDLACWRDRANALGASHIIDLEIETQDREYSFTLTLYTVADGQEVVTTPRVCDVCGLAEVSEMIEAEAARLYPKVLAARRAATLIVKTEPERATIEIDSKIVGAAPLEWSVRPGEHVVRARKRGYVARERRVLAAAGSRETITLVLPEQPREGRVVLRNLGWGLFAGGLGLVGAGVPLIAIEERPVKNRCSGDNVDDVGLCKFRYRTIEGGIALTVSGAVAVIVGIGLLARYAVEKRRGRATVNHALRRGF